ncbi:MAG: hypothetical protein NTX74_07525 [Flavobacterium sp.]|nr:hypothetical protein [Flavobacterium sp.]
MLIKKSFLILVGLGCIAALAGYYYVFHAGERNAANEEAVYTLSTAELVNEFNTDTQKANAKYNNKTITIIGVATVVSATEIKLDDQVICSFQTATTRVIANQKTTIKGRFVGYDELFGEFKFDQCTLLKTDN